MPLIKLNNRSIKDVTSLPFGVGTLVHIQSQTASNSASISFTTGINSTYKEYQFYFINMRPATDQVPFMFNLSTDGGSTYAVTKTTSIFRAFHQEDDSVYQLSYYGSYDLAQSTADQAILWSVGNASDESGVGTLQLFNPSSTTYVKHYIFTGNEYEGTNYTINGYVGGYGNTTSAINAIQFKFQTGNIADGTIAMFGVV
jgi:hypothetical protein